MKLTPRSAMACMAFVFSLPASSEALPDILVLGDDVRVKVMEQCIQPCRSGANTVATVPLGSSASSIATLAQLAKHAVIVLDATQGPLPAFREHVQIARLAGIPSLSLLLVNVDQVEDIELLKLEEMEVRELMSTYDMNGDTAPVFHDARHVAVEMPEQNVNGLASALAALKDTPERPLQALTFITGQKLAVVISLLTPAESALALTLHKDSPVTVWINGHVGQVLVSSTTVLNPGDNGELSVQLSVPVSAAAGSLLFLEREGRIVATGVVQGVSSQ
jgi:hypothetical protein